MSYHPDHVSCISLLHCLSAPSLPIHYRCLNATTNRSAPVPGFDTQYLDGAATLIFSLSIPVTGSRDSHIEPGEDSSRPLCRTPRRQQSGFPRRYIPSTAYRQRFRRGVYTTQRRLLTPLKSHIIKSEQTTKRTENNIGALDENKFREPRLSQD